MNNSPLKGIAIIAAAMVVVGLTLTGIGFIAGGNQPIHFDSDGIHVGSGKVTDWKAETLSQKLESFSSINADLDIYDVDLIPSDKYAIEAVFNPEYGKPDFRIENDTLIVEAKNKKFHVDIDIFGFTNRKNMSVKIYYPTNTKLKDVEIHVDASDLSVENLTAEKAEFDLDLGKLEISNISAKNIKVEMDSGDCTMNKITADDLNVTNDLGKTTLDGGALKTLKIKSDSGDVTISDVTVDYGDLNLDLGKLTAKNLDSNGLKVKNDSGDINLQGTLLGTTDITCNMGKVTVEPGAPKDQFNYELKADLGKVTVGGESVSGSISSSAAAKNTLKVNTDMGDININFN
ncbi:MAG: DUF4097 family beta strand repeat-containing protein [Bacillota bacterium]